MQASRRLDARDGKAVRRSKAACAAQPVVRGEWPERKRALVHEAQRRLTVDKDWRWLVTRRWL